MLQYLKQESNIAFTENGAVTYKSTQSDCLDLFSTIGALRRASEQEIIARFIRAFAEDKDIAVKSLFFARDIRGGLGERKVFRVILNWLGDNSTETVRKNMSYIAEYGRFDDLFALFGTAAEKDMLAFLKSQLERDLCALERGEEVSLLAKWLPSVNASNRFTVLMAKKIARYMCMNDATYRRVLVRLRAHIKIIENNLREKNYTFDYEKQPSKALFKYRKAFSRNDALRYRDFLDRASKGEAKLNASTLAPYELIDPYLTSGWGASRLKRMTDDDKRTLNATWEALTDSVTRENAIAVVDTSGSMYWDSCPSPAAVALSLGLYFAETNTGVFKNHFIEFSTKPQLIEVKGETFVEKLEYITSFNEIADTNIEAVFDLILRTAVKNRLSQEDLPSTIVIISDMEFNSCVENASETNFNNAKRKYADAGYKLPNVVFWNVASRNTQQPVTKNEQGVALVSGCTTKLFNQVLDGDLKEKTAYEIMLDILGNERYDKIVA